MITSAGAQIRARADFLCRRSIRAAMMLVLIGIVGVGNALAATVPGFDRSISINAREQPVDGFIAELFGKLGVPVQVDDGIVGSVNGDFRKSAGEIFQDIASSFQLTLYFDGAVAHVYPANDIMRDILYMPSSVAKQVQRNAQKLELMDPNNQLSVSDVGLVVTGTARFSEQVEQLSNATRKIKSSSTSNQDVYRVFKLRYAWAADVSLAFGGETVVVPGVATLIRQLIEPGALSSEAPSVVRIPGSPTLDGLRGKGLQNVSGGPNASATESTSESVKGPKPAAVAAAPRNGSTSNTRIVADTLSNSIVIRDRAERMDVYETLIESLDTEPQMIEIEATIIDLDTDRLRELGINWRFQRGDGVEALLGSGTNSDLLLDQNAQVTPSAQGGVVSLVLGSQQRFISRIRALETQGAARIVSKPHVMTLANVEALLDTTQTFFVRVAGQEEVDLFDVSVGTTLRVTPHVYERDGKSQIKLRVNIEDGSTSDQFVDQIPVIERSTINTQAIIDVGQSLLIGGLVRELKSNGVSKIPLLGDIPGLGALFRTNTKTSSRTERMFLITPRVNLSQPVGKRYSAPVLAGTESDIIASSGTRTLATQQALELRDEAYPLRPELPSGKGLSTSEPSVAQPFQPIAPQRVDVPAPRDSLRDRLRLPGAEKQIQVMVEPDPVPHIRVTREPEPVRPDPMDEWRDIPATPVVMPVSRALSDLIESELNVTHDGWQDIQ